MTDDFPSDDDDGIPWASPEIQLNYEAALGRFILVYNAIDNLVTKIIGIVSVRIERMDLMEECLGKSFSRKLRVLEKITLCSEGERIAGLDMKLLKELNDHRNKLAHGHYDYNYNAFFDGKYHLVNRNDKHSYSPQKIDDLLQKANKALSQLHFAEASYDFEVLSDDDIAALFPQEP